MHVNVQTSHILVCCYYTWTAAYPFFVSFTPKHNVVQRYPPALIKHSKIDPTSSAVLAYLQIRKKLTLLPWNTVFLIHLKEQVSFQQLKFSLIRDNCLWVQNMHQASLCRIRRLKGCSSWFLLHSLQVQAPSSYSHLVQIKVWSKQDNRSTEVYRNPDFAALWYI